MRLNSKWLMVLFVLAVFPLSGCGFITKLQARNNLNKGVKAYTDQKYEAAAQYFEKSLELDPNFESARMYLATAYSSQFIPGANDPKSLEMADKAIKTFEEVVAKAADPNKPNRNAMLGIASIYFQLKQPDTSNKSKEWCNRVLKFYPDNAEAYYRIAVIDNEEASDKTGVNGENVAAMKPEDKAKILADIDEGITVLGKALEILPDYYQAMECQNLLWREKAKFEKDPQAKAKMNQTADLLYLKSISLKKKAQEAEAKKPKKLGVLGAK
jgi:tetratricopeptide (TPR) repeat protein